MSSISEEDNNPKTELNQFNINNVLGSSNNSQNEEDLFFSLNCLILRNENLSKTAPAKSTDKGKIFDSDDIEIKFANAKKNLFSSENVKRLDKNKYSEAISTEPTSMKVKNYNTPKKRRYSFYKLVEKEKRVKKDNYSMFKKKEKEKEISPEKKERTDIYGNLICKKNKKNVKVSFIDKVTTQPLVNIISIENFKNYNYINGPKEENLDKKANCQCCITF